MRGLNKGGSILLEALLSVVILSVSITLIIQSMTGSYRAMVYSGQYMTALILLENKMSDAIRGGYINTGLAEQGDLSGSSGKYRYFLRTYPSDGEGQEHISEVDLGVEWAAGKRKNRINLKTYLLNPPE